MTLIEQLAEMVVPVPGTSIQRNEKEMLVTLDLGQQRKQAVRIVTFRGVGGTPFVRLQSRARVVQEYRLVRAAMEQNAKNSATALSIDATVEPPMLDVMCGIPALNLYPGEFIDLLFRVARHADGIERASAGTDNF